LLSTEFKSVYQAYTKTLTTNISLEHSTSEVQSMKSCHSTTIIIDRMKHERSRITKWKATAGGIGKSGKDHRRK